MMTSNLHYPKSATATRIGSGASWLTITADNGCSVTVFMAFDKAQAMADAFNGVGQLIDLAEELRDHKPEVISGRSSNPEDDVDDMMALHTFEAFQQDAATALVRYHTAAQECTA